MAYVEKNYKNTKEDIEEKIKGYLEQRHFRVGSKIFHEHSRSPRGLFAENFEEATRIGVFQADPYSYVINYSVPGRYDLTKGSPDAKAPYIFARELQNEDLKIIDDLINILSGS